MATLPPLYKYLDVQGATLTLTNRTLKHSKPSYFNDVEDLTIKSIFPESDDVALDIMNSGLTDIILRNLNAIPTTENESQRAKILQIQSIYRTNPKAADIVKKAMKERPVYRQRHATHPQAYRSHLADAAWSPHLGSSRLFGHERKDTAGHIWPPPSGLFTRCSRFHRLAPRPKKGNVGYFVG